VAEAEARERLRALPSIDRLLQTEPLRSAAEQAPHGLALAAARAELEQRRNAIRHELAGDGAEAHDGDGSGGPPVAEVARAAAARLERLLLPSLTPVINATGVVVHTNLGRAPLADEALEEVQRSGASYSNLEYDLEQGTRGSRHVHVEALIRELTGAEAGFALNNNAAAVLLALAALASRREVIISRGQLVEIGGSFRIPEILESSGARLVEVGTTNRTRLDDYERAIGDETAALMRVHTSNFRMLGFTEEVAIEDLCELARRRDVVVIDDLGSGVLSPPARDAEAKGAGGSEDAGSTTSAARLARLAEVVSDEPSATRSIAAGADVVCFSGDKLLGGPQAGLVAGRRGAVERMRSHPLARALRIDKLSLAALEATLRLHRDPERAALQIPVLRMLSAPEEELALRASRLREAVVSAVGERAEVEVVRASGRVGGGALPLLELEGPVVSVRPRSGGLERLAGALRASERPVLARLREGALLLDPRTMSEEEVDVAATQLAAALGAA
jgi:L-seryl-tRNA(Ser) seleniumtransferase